MNAPVLARLAEDQPSCHVPWCCRDDRDTGTHGSPVERAESVTVILTAVGARAPYVVIGSVLAVPPGEAKYVASLLARLGHAELAALITSTAALAGGGE